MNYAAIKKAITMTAEQVIHELTAAGLRDRDYQNLSTGKGLREHLLTKEAGRRLPDSPETNIYGDLQIVPKDILCDCVDQEQDLSINRFLIKTQGNEIVDGALVAAYATGSSRILIYVAEDKENIEYMRTSIEEATQQFDELGLKMDIELIKGPPIKPLMGLSRYPMTINGETAMNVATVINSGKEWYRRIGHPDSPGTKIFEVKGSVKKPGIYEVPTNTTLRRLIEDLCGDMEEGKEMLGVILGGTQGGFFTEQELDISLDFDSVKAAGATIGAGSIRVLDINCGIK